MSTYRAAISHGVPLTDESQADLSDDVLIAAAIEEAAKPEVLGVLLTADDITIDTWTH